MYSMDKNLINRLLEETVPSFQTTCKETTNLGFGLLFYAFTRAVRPKQAVVIGSKAGFAPLCFAIALNDNEGNGVKAVDCEETIMTNPGEIGKLDFIDPSYSLHRGDEGHWYGLGNWDDTEKVQKLWQSYGVEHIVEHHKMTSQQYLAEISTDKKIDLLYVDGDHSYEGVTHDLTQFYNHLSKDAMVLAHDVDPRLEEGGGYRAFQDISPKMYEKVRLPIYPGLAIMRKLEP